MIETVSKSQIPPLQPGQQLTTCDRAAELGRTMGARVYWRPNGVINWMLPGMDPAIVVEG